MKTVAAFDFDGTLTYGDSLLSFLLFVNGPIRTFWKLFLSSPALIRFCLGTSSRQKTKEVIIKKGLSHLSYSELQVKAKQFAKNILPKKLRPEAVEKLRWHQSQGHTIVIISASVSLYLIPWSKLMGVETVLSSELAYHEDKITGKLVGINCWGPEKVRRLKEKFPEDFLLFAYGDSCGDQELLALADHPYYRCF